MHLYLDTTERDSFVVALMAGRKVVKKRTIKSARGHSEKLLKTIVALLKSANKSARDIAGIAVVKGPGSFTSLRIGVSCANAFGYGLGVPVVGVGKDVPLVDIVGLFGRVRPSKKINVILPEYGREPNITIKK